MSEPPSPELSLLPTANPSSPIHVPQSQEAGPSHVPHTASLTQSVSLSPDAANLAQTTAASDSLPSDSGDTGLDKARESGTSWGRSSEERRREGSQSEQGGAGRDTKSKRLSQNRLAARKSRQRRKEYVECLEEEVRTLRSELRHEQEAKSGQGRASSSGPPTSPGATVPPLPVRAAVEPPRFSQWTAAAAPNPLQMATEPGPSQAMGSSALRPWAEGSAAGPYGITLPIPGSPSDLASSRVLHAFERWHAQHAVSVRALLEVRSEGSLAGPLAERLINVVVHLSELFRLKAAVLRGDDAHLVLSLQHLPQGQRRFAPLGVLSCSDICAGLLYRLGPSLELHQRLFLEQYKLVYWLQTSLMTQEAALHVLLSGAIAEVTQMVAQVRVPLGPPALPTLPTGPDIQAKLQLMCEVFIAADALWEHFLQHAEQYLSVPQFVTVVSAMAESYSFEGPGMRELPVYSDDDIQKVHKDQALLQCNHGLTSSIEQL